MQTFSSRQENYFPGVLDRFLELMKFLIFVIISQQGCTLKVCPIILLDELHCAVEVLGQFRLSTCTKPVLLLHVVHFAPSVDKHEHFWIHQNYSQVKTLSCVDLTNGTSVNR
jgi:hypothetical protein